LTVKKISPSGDKGTPQRGHLMPFLYKLI